MLLLFLMLLAFNVLGKWFKNNFWKVLMCDRWGNVCVLVSVNTNTRIRHELEGRPLQDGLILHGFNNPRSTMTSSEWPNNNHEKFIWLLLLVFFHWAATVKNWGASTKDLGQLQTWAPHLGITTFNAINEKSTIFGWFCSNLQGLTHPWCGQSLKVWAKLVKNYTIFINSNKSCDS